MQIYCCISQVSIYGQLGTIPPMSVCLAVCLFWEEFGVEGRFVSFLSAYLSGLHGIVYILSVLHNPINLLDTSTKAKM